MLAAAGRFGWPEVTLQFSLNASGSIIGKPRISHSKLGPDENLNKDYVASALKAMDTCTPVAMTPGLSGAIAGCMIAILFRLPPKRA